MTLQDALEYSACALTSTVGAAGLIIWLLFF